MNNPTPCRFVNTLTVANVEVGAIFTPVVEGDEDLVFWRQVILTAAFALAV
jgi:hypothetical protein